MLTKVDTESVHRVGNQDKIKTNIDQSLLILHGTIVDRTFLNKKKKLKTLESRSRKVYLPSTWKGLIMPGNILVSEMSRR